MTANREKTQIVSQGNNVASTYCQICGRELTDPESVRYGIGPVCRSRQCKNDRIWRACQDKGAHNEELYIEGIDIQELARKIYEKKPSCSCGKTLESYNLEHYLHEGGEQVKGYEKPQWLYIHCDNCGYDMALWKIRRELD